MLGHQQLPSLSPQPPHSGLNSGYNSNDFASTNSPSPPLNSVGIRLPNAPLSDIAEYRTHSNDSVEYSNGEYIEYINKDPEIAYPDTYEDSYNNSSYNSTSISPSPHPPTPHSLPLPLSATNSPYLGSSHLASPHLGSPHLGSPGNMIPSPLADAQLSAGSSSNGSTNTLLETPSSAYSASVEILSSPDSANNAKTMTRSPSFGRDLLAPIGSGGGARNKAYTISTPYEAYLNASREERDLRMLYPARERSGSVSSAYSTSSASSAHSSRASSILNSVRSVHVPLPEVEGDGGDVLGSVSGSMSEMHMGFKHDSEVRSNQTLDPSILNDERV
ncbi:hypothetical protein C8R42DRAFT_723060 [Lentinula raphanica]|nr:hypothetical protein C8R42DRAFT_723060 [Lentinula raphanica]